MDGFLATGNMWHGGASTRPEEVKGDGTKPEAGGLTTECSGANGLGSCDGAEGGTSLGRNGDGGADSITNPWLWHKSLV